jgi:preprotein translocase subunit SecG
MEQILLVAHLLIALGIIGLIMLQQGKGAEMGASFGSGGSQTLFGSDGGGNMLTKATTLLVILFFTTSFGLAIVARNGATLVDEIDIPVPMPEQVQAPQDFDLPELNNDMPAGMSAGDDIPVVE